MRTTRRGFFGMVAGAVAAAVLPKPVKKWTVYPPIQIDLPPGVKPLAGLEGLVYWQTVPSDMVYLGISRGPLPANDQFNRSAKLIDDYFNRRQYGQQEQG